MIKIGPLPVKLAVQGAEYMPVHPDVFGQKWNLQFAITPVIPKLVKGNISVTERSIILFPIEGWLRKMKGNLTA